MSLARFGPVLGRFTRLLWQKCNPTQKDLALDASKLAFLVFRLLHLALRMEVSSVGGANFLIIHQLLGSKFHDSGI